MKKLWKRLRQTVQGRRFEAELADELRIHREMAEDAARRGGAAPDEARRQSARAFGGEALALEDSRAVWRFAWLDSLAQDIRYALRGFRKSPGFALTAIGTLALGLGTLATAFSVFNAFALRPFPVRDARSLYWFEWQARDSNHAPATWREFTDLRTQKAAFSDVLAYQPAMAPLMGRQAWVEEVSGNYFTMLGGLTCMGRPILESDDEPASPAVAVVAYDMWKSRFGADPDVVGRTLYVRGQPVEIVGVACAEFNGLSRSPVAAWVSQALSATLANGPYGPQEDAWTVVGRLKPGMGAEGARAALLAYGRQVSPGWKSGSTPERVQLEQRWLYWMQGVHIGGFQRIFVVFGLILLIACANVSNMMLARCLARQREIGVRISLGAGRGRMIRQLLTESLLLALLAALTAFAVAHATIKAAVWLAPSLVSFGPTDLAPDWRVMAFLLAAGICSTLVFGLMPALQATRSSLVQANRGEFANGYRPALLRNALVAIQVTLCAFLLILASVALRQERAVASQGAGLDVHNVFSVRLPGKFQAPADARLRSDPRVVSVGAFRFGGLSFMDDAAMSGRRIYVPNSMVSPEYFGILRVPIMRGRNFSEADAGAEVAILSEAAARRLCPRQDALGRTLTFSSPRSATVTVIGIVRDAVYNGYIEVENGRLNTASVFFPMDPKLNDLSLLVRTRGDAGPARRAIETEVDRLTLGEAGEAIPMEEMQAGWQSNRRILLGITGFLGLQALLLTVTGIYGVLSHLVSQRKREIGIRIALGADGGAVARMVLRQSAWLAAAGAAMGAVLALGAARVMASNAMAMIAFDPVGYAVGMSVVIAAALAASWVPARRAVRVDPAVTLRCD